MCWLLHVHRTKHLSLRSLRLICQCNFFFDGICIIHRSLHCIALLSVSLFHSLLYANVCMCAICFVCSIQAHVSELYIYLILEYLIFSCNFVILLSVGFHSNGISSTIFYAYCENTIAKISTSGKAGFWSSHPTLLSTQNTKASLKIPVRLYIRNAGKFIDYDRQMDDGVASEAYHKQTHT